MTSPRITAKLLTGDTSSSVAVGRDGCDTPVVELSLHQAHELMVSLAELFVAIHEAEKRSRQQKVKL